MKRNADIGLFTEPSIIERMAWTGGPMLQRKRVLIVDPSPIFRRKLKETIQTNETLVDVIEADDIVQAETVLSNQLPDVVFIDMAIFDEAGRQFIQSIKSLSAGVQIVVLAGSDSADFKERVLAMGVDHVLPKALAAGLRLIDVIHAVVRR
jgi:DNA-binding NarL/FixJ family response regulator